jgi:hypothetical protein
MKISGLTHAASVPALLRFALRVATHAQGWLPAGWLAFTGRVSNPLDHYERFQITWSSPFPVLLTLPVPLLRSSTPVEPMCPCLGGHTGAAPRWSKSEGFGRWRISGLTHAASAPAVLRFALRVTAHAQGWLPAGWLAFTVRVSRTLWITAKGFRSHDRSPSLFS